MIAAGEVIGAALEDFGQQAIVVGTAEILQVIASLDGSALLDNGQLDRIGPYCLAAYADVAALGIEGGNNGDLLEIDGGTYRVLAIDPDGSGVAALSLVEV